jgi:hypothetical protein
VRFSVKLVSFAKTAAALSSVAIRPSRALVAIMIATVWRAGLVRLQTLRRASGAHDMHRASATWYKQGTMLGLPHTARIRT